MNQVNFSLTFDKRLANEESHVHRITQFYKRAVLDQKDKTWAHFFYIGSKKVNFTIKPKAGFFESSNLMVSSDSRYEMLKNAAMRSNSVCVNRLTEIHKDLDKSNREGDWLQIVDLLDDLEDVIFETEEERSAYTQSQTNRYINTFNFIKVSKMPNDQEIQDAISRLNECAKFYYTTNVIIQKGRCKRAIEKAEKAINQPRLNKEELLSKVQIVVELVKASFTKKNLTRSIRMVGHFDRSIHIDAEQEKCLIPNSFDDSEIDAEYVQSIYREIEEFSGNNILRTRNDFKLKYDKKHWDDILTNIEKIIDFANIPLTNELVVQLEELSFLLTQERPDNEALDNLTNQILETVIPMSTSFIMDFYFEYKRSPSACKNKISTIDDLISSNNFQSAYARIIDLKKK